jgi:hypothetical protein
MAFPVLGHVDAEHRTFVAIDGLGQRLGELGLAHAGRPEEQKVATGLPPSRRPARDNRTASATARTASSWPTRLLMQPLFQMQQLLAFFHRQLVDRNAGQARDDLRDMLVDFGAARGALALPILDER